MRRVLNTFFGGIYSANEHRGHERALADAALITAAWSSFVLMTAIACVLSAVGRFAPIIESVQESIFLVAALVAFSFSWMAIRRLGDGPLTGPRFDLDTFVKKRVFGVGCIALPLVLALIARVITIGSLR